MTPHISIQLWPARQLELRRTLETVAGLGYDSIQAYPFWFAQDAKAFRHLVDEFGLTIPSVHMELSDVRDEPARWIEMAHVMGANSITIPHLRRTETRPDSAEGWLHLSDALAETAARLTREGIRIGWANHDHEYRRLSSGQRPIDLILARPEVDYELVSGWLTMVGENVEDELALRADRIRTLRLRDWSRKQSSFTSIGDGDLGYDRVWPAIARLPELQQLVVDTELPQDFERFATRSLDNLRELISSHPFQEDVPRPSTADPGPSGGTAKHG